MMAVIWKGGMEMYFVDIYERIEFFQNFLRKPLDSFQLSDKISPIVTDHPLRFRCCPLVDGCGGARWSRDNGA